MFHHDHTKPKQATGFQPRNGMKFLQSFWAGIPIFAAVYLLVLIAKNGVNVPFGDEWTIPGQFLVQKTHSFADFFAQSNESRLVIPKLIFLVASKFVGWQPKHYMYFGWLIVLWTGVMTYTLCFRRLKYKGTLDSTSKACVVLMSLLLFSPAAYENWLWGLQWVIFVPLLCILACFCLQDRIQSFWARYFVTVIMNTIAMFSFSNGMLVWVVSFPFWKETLAYLSAKRLLRVPISRPMIWSVVYLTTAIIFILAYFRNYQRNPAHPSFTYFLQQPWNTLKYLAAWCGGSIHGNAALHILLGFLAIFSILILLGFIAAAIRNPSGCKTYYCLRMLYPSLLIVAYAVSSGTLTALGRAGFGLEQAYSSRYLFHSGALLIGLIAAFNVQRVTTLKLGQITEHYKTIFNGTVVLLIILAVRTWNHNCKMFELMKFARMEDLLTVRLLPLAPTSPLVEKISAGVNLPALVKSLEAQNVYNPSKFGVWISDSSRISRLEARGAIAFSAKSAAEITVEGWALISDHDRPPDSVLICRSGQNKNLEPWMMLAVGRKRDDLVKATGQISLLKSGLMETFPWKSKTAMPQVDVFAVDERNKSLYRIPRLP